MQSGKRKSDSLPNELYKNLLKTWTMVYNSPDDTGNLDLVEKALALVPFKDLSKSKMSQSLEDIIIKLLREALDLCHRKRPEKLAYYSKRLSRLLDMLEIAEESVIFVVSLFYRCVEVQIEVESQWRTGFEDAHLHPIAKRDWDNKFEETSLKGIDFGERALSLLRSGQRKKAFAEENSKNHSWNVLMEAKLLIEMGNILIELAKLDDDYFKKSKEEFTKALQCAKKLNDQKLEFKCLYNIGYLNENLELYDFALNCYKEELAYRMKHFDYSNSIITKLSMADCYLKKFKNQKAYELVTEAKKLVDRITSESVKQKRRQEIEEKLKVIRVQIDYSQELQILLQENSEDGLVYKKMTSLTEKNLRRAIEIALIIGQEKMFLAAFECTFRPTQKIVEEESKKLNFLTLPTEPIKLEGSTASEKMAKFASWDSKTTEQSYPVRNPALHAALLNYLSSGHLAWMHEPLLEVFLTRRTFRPTSIPLFTRILADKYARVSKLLESADEEVEDFVLQSVELANVIDDAFNHKETSEVPDIIEKEFWRVMDMIKIIKNVRLMGVILVNLEIIYKKYNDQYMKNKVADIIEKFKKTERFDEVVIERRVRTLQNNVKLEPVTAKRPEFNQYSKRGMDIEDGDSDSSHIPEFIGDFKSISIPLPFQPKSRENSSPNIISPLPRKPTPVQSKYQFKQNKIFSNLASEAMLLKITSNYTPLGPYLQEAFVAEINLRSLFESDSVDFGQFAPMSQSHLDSLFSTLARKVSLERMPVSLRIKSLDFGGLQISRKHLNLLEKSELSRVFFEGLCTYKHRKAEIDHLTAQSIIEKLNPNITECQLGGFLQESHGMDDIEISLQIASHLLSLPKIYKLGLEKFGLSGIHGIQFEAGKLNHLGLAGNSITPAAAAWIIMKCYCSYTRLDMLDLSRQKSTPPEFSLPGYLYEVSDSVISKISLLERKNPLKDHLTKDPEDSNQSGKQYTLNLRGNSDFIDFVLQSFSNDTRNEVWRSLRSAICCYTRLLLGDIGQTAVRDFCRLLDHPATSFGDYSSLVYQ